MSLVCCATVTVPPRVFVFFPVCVFLFVPIAVLLADEANETALRENGARRIEFASFYNDVVNEDLPMEQDFKRWMTSRKMEQQGTGSTFSFCGHPFLLDAASKSQILKLDAAVQQRANLMRCEGLLFLARAACHDSERIDVGQVSVFCTAAISSGRSSARGSAD